MLVTSLRAVTSLFLAKEVFGCEKEAIFGGIELLTSALIQNNDWLENFRMSESTFKYIHL
jgi:hypothetical protein